MSGGMLMPYPYRECQRCGCQIHVGGIYICDACARTELDNRRWLAVEARLIRGEVAQRQQAAKSHTAETDPLTLEDQYIISRQYGRIHTAALAWYRDHGDAWDCAARWARNLNA